MSSVIAEINTEFTSRITEIQNNNEFDEYEINSNRAEWKDILSLYTVIISNGEEKTEVITLDDEKVNTLKDIFWSMNTITYNIKEIEKNIETTDDYGKSERNLSGRGMLLGNRAFYETDPGSGSHSGRLCKQYPCRSGLPAGM